MTEQGIFDRHVAELHAALERMRVEHPHLWKVHHRLHPVHDADPSKLEEWRQALEGSEERQ